MNWYIAKIVFNIKSGEGRHTAQFDEQLRLISAVNKEQALLKARILGLNDEDSFKNDKNESVKWQFIDVADLHPVELRDGIEVYSSIYETEEARPYISYVQDKASSLVENSLTYAYEM